MIEIRVITYKRPRLLLRALRSIQSQTHTQWRAVVYDDSKEFESHGVVQALADPRISVIQNPKNLGMIANLSQAFAALPVFPDSTHACILEDDNAFDPTWLEKNIEDMKASLCRVMCRNYRVVNVNADGQLEPTAHEPMRDLYGSEPRFLDYEERVREAFFSFTIGTSCFFWDLRSGIDLSISCEQVHGQLIEPIRSTCFRDPCWFAPEPLSTFSRFLDKSQTPRGETVATTRRRRIAKVSEIMFTRHLMRTWKNEFQRSLLDILVYANSRHDGPGAVLALAEAGYLAAMLRLRNRRAVIAAIKSWFVASLYRGAWQSENSKVPIPS